MSLTFIKSIHTLIWCFFVACIAGIPIAAAFGRFSVSFWLTMVILGEVFVLLINNRSCPLTSVAARHTSDRAANFDIYLPEWLARNNQTIFGALFLAGVIFALFKWLNAGG
ncbi:MAG: hypothetical protein IPJ30_00930 [Acidobacteria bacterium]|nr:hypothetical protein [Acidobacteriota bacterium]